MNFQLTSLEGSGKEIVLKAVHSDESQLLVPPRFKEQELIVPSLEAGSKHIGLFSSGTTGQPKGIWNTFERLKQNAKYTAKAFEIESYHKLLILAAPWHVAGLSWAIMAEELGCDFEFITTKKGDDKTWLKVIRKYQPDYLLTVPAVLRSLYGKQWKVPNVVFGGYSIEPNDFDLLAPHCEVMYQGYGQTEAGGLITAYKRKSPKTPGKLEHLCCGKPIKGVQLNCEGTAENPANIFIQSRTAFTQGEYDSRDLGFIDDSGNIYILGRVDETQNSK